MVENIDELKNLWNKEKSSAPQQSLNISQVIEKAEKKKKSTTNHQIGNVLILIVTAILISLFFIYVAHFNRLISHIGSGLMLGSLGIRIVIEFYSIYLSKKIDLSENTFKTNEELIKFFNFRKKIHSPVTIIILILYTIGFYLLTPEFSSYFSLSMMILIDLSYVLAAFIFCWSIRKAVRKEMRYLNEILRLQRSLSEE